MTPLKIFSSAIAAPPEPPEWDSHPAFRRATRNMKLAALVVEKTLASLPADSDRDRIGMVIATSHGELETTCQFLRELGSSGTARPLLFQNSLHNATSGFLSTHFSLRGPTFTVSNRYLSGENAIELASLLIEQTSVDRCLIVGVDSAPGSLEGMLRKMYPEGLELAGGAAALLVEEARGGERALRSIRYGKGEPPSPAGISPFYDSNSIEHVARFQSSGPLTLVKPDGTFAEIQMGDVLP